MPTPTEIRLNRTERRLEIAFDDGYQIALGAEYLRVESPSAEVQGHAPSQKVTVAGKRDVAITGVEQVGNYAIRLTFDDGHDTGIYSWDYLLELGRQQEARFGSYLAVLAAKGLRRDLGPSRMT